MVNLVPTNKKLEARAKALIQKIAGCTKERADLIWHECRGNTSAGILMELYGIPYDQAAHSLAGAHNNLHQAMALCEQRESMYWLWSLNCERFWQLSINFAVVPASHGLSRRCSLRNQSKPHDEKTHRDARSRQYYPSFRCSMHLYRGGNRTALYRWFHHRPSTVSSLFLKR